jgi:signal transduction histidine kinase
VSETNIPPDSGPAGAPDEHREATDESLHQERDKTDEEVRKRDRIEEDADAAVGQARARADHVLKESRQRADEKMEADRPSAGQRRVLHRERAQADDTVREERHTADHELAGERQASEQALANLFLLERERTDERLLVERARGDSALGARDNFMGMVAHDLRTLLGAIAMTAEVQGKTVHAKKAADDEMGRVILETAEKIRRLSARMNRLIGDLVDVASIEANRFTIDPSDLDAQALVRESLQIFESAAAAKGLRLTTIEGGVTPARGDHDRTLQVLANLLTNAIKWTAPGGTVSVRVVSVGREVLFSVTDSGVGIPADHVESVFERFWQVNKDGAGRGLGLFISKCIVEAQGGRIWTTSEVGKGSTFSFTLPGASPSDGADRTTH